MSNELYHSAKLALAQGKALEAEELLRKFLAVQPDHGTAHHLLGKLLADRKDLDKALEHQIKSCKLHSQLGWNWFAAAELLRDAGRLPSALNCFDMAIQALPQEKWIVDLAGDVKSRLLLGGESLQKGLGDIGYKYWIANHEPALPARSSMPLRYRWWLMKSGSPLKLINDDPVNHQNQPCNLSPCPADGWLLLVGADTALRFGALRALEEWLDRFGPRDLPELIYADEDQLDASGQRCRPWFKPGWSSESFWSTPWLEHFSVWRVPWLCSKGLPLPPDDPIGRWRWILTALALQPAVGHLARLLSHTKIQLPDAKLDQLRAVELLSHLQDQEEPIVSVQPCLDHGFRLSWAVPPTPDCTAIIPTRDRADLLELCLNSLESTANLRRIVVVDNNSRQPETAALLLGWRQRLGDRLIVLRDQRPFNWSRMNNAAAMLTRSELLLFINNDVAATAPGWFDAMAAQCLRSAIGCVGALLVYPDGTLQHAGMVLGMYGSAGHAYRHLSPEHGVHRGRSRYLTNWGAVTGACMMVRRELFELVAGFDEKLPVEFNDVDFCLRLAEQGFRHLVVPEAVLLHRESQSRNATGSTTAAAALELMKGRWPLRLTNSRPWWPEACSLKWPDGRPLEFDDHR